MSDIIDDLEKLIDEINDIFIKIQLEILFDISLVIAYSVLSLLKSRLDNKGV